MGGIQRPAPKLGGQDADLGGGEWDWAWRVCAGILSEMVISPFDREGIERLAACNHTPLPWCQNLSGLGVVKMKPEQSVGRNTNAVVTEISGALILPLVLG